MQTIKLNIANFSGHTYYSLRPDDKNKSNSFDAIEFSVEYKKSILGSFFDFSGILSLIRNSYFHEQSYYPIFENKHI